MKKILKIVMTVFIIIAIIFLYHRFINVNEKAELIEISSQKELEEIYGKEKGIIFKLLTLPYSLLTSDREYYNYTTEGYDISKRKMLDPVPYSADASIDSSENSISLSFKKDYSTTNIQVENVDEADVTKTDGDYIYSLSEDNVVITDVRDTSQIKIASKIDTSNSNIIPEDLMLYENKLIVISKKFKSSISYYDYNTKTVVYIYDITNKENPKEIKNYELEQPYYTSRCINGKLYVISSGSLKEEDDKIVTYYVEDGIEIDPGFSNIKRIKDLKGIFKLLFLK